MCVARSIWGGRLYLAATSKTKLNGLLEPKMIPYGTREPKLGRWQGKASSYLTLLFGSKKLIK